MFAMNADMKVRTVIYEFESRFNVRPNRIIMGYNLAVELWKKYYCQYFPFGVFEELAMERKFKSPCEYEGIPVNIDHDNPDRLEVGYMVEWMEDMY